MTTWMFDDLSFEDKIAHFTTVAKRALPLWDYPEDASLRLLNFTENATFLVTAKGFPKMIMRVHRLNYATRDSIRTELNWIQDLREKTNLSLAAPIPAADGELVRTIETPSLKEARNVVCFTFMEGKAPKPDCDSNGNVGDLISKISRIPDRITLPTFYTAANLYDTFKGKKDLTQKDHAFFAKLGTIAATLHNASESYTRPSFYERIEWDWDGTFGMECNNFYGATYRNPKWLNRKDVRILDECADLIRLRLAAYGKNRHTYGMIHSDLRPANLLQDGDTITVLDFDDCGYGWYMYDIAGITALLEYIPELPAIVNAVLEGYESVRKLSERDKDEIPTFIMMRRIGMLQSLISRIGCVMPGSGESTELTPEILEFYAAGTVKQAKQYIITQALPVVHPVTAGAI